MSLTNLPKRNPVSRDRDDAEARRLPDPDPESDQSPEVNALQSLYVHPFGERHSEAGQYDHCQHAGRR